MEGTIAIDTERLLKWSKDSDNKWTIQLVKDEENSESDGHTNLRKETVLKEMNIQSIKKPA